MNTLRELEDILERIDILRSKMFQDKTRKGNARIRNQIEILNDRAFFLKTEIKNLSLKSMSNQKF